MVKPKETTANFKPEIGSGPHQPPLGEIDHVFRMSLSGEACPATPCAVYHLFERLEAGRRRPKPAPVGVPRVNLN